MSLTTLVDQARASRHSCSWMSPLVILNGDEGGPSLRIEWDAKEDSWVGIVTDGVRHFEILGPHTGDRDDVAAARAAMDAYLDDLNGVPRFGEPISRYWT